jgi:hydroxymethylpyrimidine pyrophosphatase-like HAD family hydrolase
MGETLADLLEQCIAVVISGGKLEQLAKQVADRLPERADRNRLYLMPTSGAALAAFENGSWVVLKEERIPEDEADRVMKVMDATARATGYIDFDEGSYGPRLEYRGSQISLSALGQLAPVNKKEAWDPDRSKRMALQAAMAEALPDYNVRSGGLTTIDVTYKGIDKAYGIRVFSAYRDIPIDQMLYVGDALYPGGNDEVVIQTGIPTHSVADADDTLHFIRDLLREHSLTY